MLRRFELFPGEPVTKKKRLFLLPIMGSLLLPALSLAARADDFDELVNLGDKLVACRDAGRFEEAEQLGKQLIALAERKFRGKPPVIADCIGQLISVYDRAGRAESAQPYCRRVIEIREQTLGKEHPELVYPLTVLGDGFRSQRQFAEAEKQYRRSLRICEKTLARGEAAPPNYLPNLVHLAAIYEDQGRFAEAEPLLGKALPLAEKSAGPESMEVARVVNNLATIQSGQGHFAQAEGLLKRSLRIKKKLLGDEHFEVGIAYGNLGLNLVRQGRLAEAEPLYLQALAVSEKWLDASQPAEFGYASPGQAVISSLENLANLKVEQQKFQEAEPYYRQALEVQEKLFGPESPVLAQTISNLGVMQLHQQHYDEAEVLFDRAIRLIRQGGAAPSLLYNVLISRSLVYWFTDKHGQSLADLQLALEMADQMRATFSGDETQRAEAAAYQFWRAYELMVGCQRDEGDVAEAFAAAERRKARTLVDQINLQGVDLLAGVPPAEASLLREQDTKATEAVTALEQQLSQCNTQAELPEAQRTQTARRLTAELEAAREKAVETYRAIRNASPAYRLAVSRDFLPLELATLHEWVKQQSALLLEYFVGQEHCYVIAVPSDGEPQIVMLGELSAEAASLLGTTPGWLNAQRLQQATSLDGKPLADVFKSPAARQGELARAIEQGSWLLWQLLVPEEFRLRLTNGAYKRLIVIPDAGLQSLPFDALVTEIGESSSQGSKYLLDVGPAMVTAPSATLLYNLAVRPAPNERSLDENENPTRVLSVGDPDYSAAYGSSPTRDWPKQRGNSSRGSEPATLRGELAPLPYSGREMKWVAESFNPVGMTTRTLTKREATEEAVRKAMRGCEIVHLACHGLADQTHGNLFGALALAKPRRESVRPADDGFLTLAEIYALDLKRCELAVLSACETNLGPQQQGEGIFALSRGFMVAGARRVVATNWLVDDQSSASLVSVFCSVLAKQRQAGQPLDYAQALHKAKQWVRKHERWQHPYYWGAFTLIGPG